MRPWHPPRAEVDGPGATVVEVRERDLVLCLYHRTDYRGRVRVSSLVRVSGSGEGSGPPFSLIMSPPPLILWEREKFRYIPSPSGSENRSSVSRPELLGGSATFQQLCGSDLVPHDDLVDVIELIPGIAQPDEDNVNMGMIFM